MMDELTAKIEGDDAGPPKSTIPEEPAEEAKETASIKPEGTEQREYISLVIKATQ